ncbi:hypothetical protein D0862_00372 [Hortaea werneckii]|uniref:Nucleoporin Nup54 alpha-helical domain-containing protein n=1 Tax=Hortaea werneckii TaxID=91943 RepID=A0A3M7HZ73_HORWE|nr:hypothetical protein D0862_00372 [Hortaea werneckii]
MSKHKRTSAEDLQLIQPLRRNALTEPSGGGQQNQNPTSQPQQSGGLFGSTTTSQPSQGGGLFGGTLGGQSSQPQQSGGLFGSTTNQNQQNTGGSSLFGNTQQNQQSNTGGGSLFGGSNTQQNQQNNTTGGSLFGSSTMPSQSNTGGGGGLFSSLNQNNQSNQQQGNSLFGGSTSLFAPKPNDPSQGMAGNSFYHASNPQSRPTANSIFGLNPVPPDQVPSLLQSQQFAQSQRGAPFAGSLKMGQTQQAGQQASVGAVKVHASELRPTTRFQDCIDEVKDKFEQTDKMIQAQEQFCRQIQALIGRHEPDVQSIAPDVQLVKEKADAVEQLLASDAHAVERSRTVKDKDHKDFARAQRIIENLKLPSGYQVPNSGVPLGYPSSYGRQSLARPADPADGAVDADSYDTDLIGHYFVPMASELQDTLNQYSSNLAEIEGHMRVIESSAISQAQQLAARRAGVNNGQLATEDDTVRELADTLRGFERSILNVAGTVGECREGVNELALGRLGETLGAGSRPLGSVRPW